MEIIEQYDDGSAMVRHDDGTFNYVTGKQMFSGKQILKEMPSFTEAHSKSYELMGTKTDKFIIKEDRQVTTNQVNINTKNTNKKGITTMKANLKGMFKIEKVQNGEVALTFGGAVAVRRKNGDYVNYDETVGQIVNSADLVIDGIDKMIMILPTQEVSEGDVVKVKGTYVHVLNSTDRVLKGINLETGTTTNIVKEKNIFGIEFFQKVTNLMSDFGGQEGINPMMFLALGDKEIDPMMLMMMMQGAGGTFNPMMLLALADGDIDPMMLMMMQGQQGGQAINPMMFALMGDGDFDMKTLMMMNMMQGGNGFKLF